MLHKLVKGSDGVAILNILIDFSLQGSALRYLILIMNKEAFNGYCWN